MLQGELLSLEQEGDGGVHLVLGDGEPLEPDGRDETLLEVLLHIRNRHSRRKKICMIRILPNQRN